MRGEDGFLAGLGCLAFLVWLAFVVTILVGAWLAIDKFLL